MCVPCLYKIWDGEEGLYGLSARCLWLDASGHLFLLPLHARLPPGLRYEELFGLGYVCPPMGSGCRIQETVGGAKYDTLDGDAASMIFMFDEWDVVRLILKELTYTMQT